MADNERIRQESEHAGEAGNQQSEAMQRAKETIKSKLEMLYSEQKKLD
jgi:hypothetical protein